MSSNVVNQAYAIGIGHVAPVVGMGAFLGSAGVLAPRLWQGCKIMSYGALAGGCKLGIRISDYMSTSKREGIASQALQSKKYLTQKEANFSSALKSNCDGTNLKRDLLIATGLAAIGVAAKYLSSQFVPNLDNGPKRFFTQKEADNYISKLSDTTTRKYETTIPTEDGGGYVRYLVEEAAPKTLLQQAFDWIDV